MLSVGIMSLASWGELKVDNSDVLAMSIEKTSKTKSGALLWVATDDGDYTYEFNGAVVPVATLDNWNIFYNRGALLSFVPYNYNL